MRERTSPRLMHLGRGLVGLSAAMIVLALVVLDGTPGSAKTGVWRSLPRMPADRDEIAYAYVDGEFHLFGDGTQHYVYDPGRRTWTLGPAMPVSLHHIQAAVLKGKIYLVGGLKKWPAGDVGTMYIYDASSNRITKGPSLPSGRSRGAGGIVAYKGKIYAVGGLHGGVVVPWLDVFDPATGRWKSLPDMPAARDHFHAVVADGKLWAIGGRNVKPNKTTRVTQAFDFAAGRWRTGFAPLPTARGGFAAVKLRGDVVIIGGEAGGQAWNTVEAYDPATDRWRTLPSMPTARHGIQGAVCGGAVYLAGGATDQGGGHSTNINEAYFPDGAPGCGN